jgi:lysophospholipase L1-like esterase
VAEELGAPFIDAAAYVECPMPDGIHLSSEGQRTLGTVIADWIQKQLLP